MTRDDLDVDPDELYGRLKAYEGRTAASGGAGRDPVNEPMIRHWCEAMGDTNPAYPAVAPPTMLQAWTMGGLAGHPGGSARSEAYDELLALLDDVGCTSVVATDCEQEYLRPLRPGDRVTFDAVIESVSPRKATKLGTGYFVTTRMNVRAGDGELVGTHRFRILKYAPARPRKAARPEPTRKPEPTRTPEPTAGRPRRPRPVINRDNAGFWAGVARHQLLIQRCLDCATPRFPWLPGCGACGSQRWETFEASGAGTVFSYVVMHHPPFPAFDPPYAVALVELAEGVRMVSDITGVPYDKVRIGMPVELEFLRVDEELELPVFRGAEA
ncbi:MULTISPECIES: bifunctional MaoC family dehydratase N-terminal/OB-fold nucleic acid binding domain-containing protein [Streptomyces violaceusniger group]|uniref:Bifunctional MaoC family dehydratase N-terminal/OB-fold nucleic acid binding domain-containing protein n=2 Tax=Streptomyces javensis TaxID=114698 RepID=A0ABP4I684_9ACTN|nr:OB-fold domain-containing protein [Streptomyces javensis]MBI0319524.1 OB-fold domain-containing protein [Streptomyces javensis]